MKSTLDESVPLVFQSLCQLIANSMAGLNYRMFATYVPLNAEQSFPSHDEEKKNFISPGFGRLGPTVIHRNGLGIQNFEQVREGIHRFIGGSPLEQEMGDFII